MRRLLTMAGLLAWLAAGPLAAQTTPSSGPVVRQEPVGAARIAFDRAGETSVVVNGYADRASGRRLTADDPVRGTPNIILSPHQAGAMESTLNAMGASITADIELIARGLPPAVCKVAQPETAMRFRSMPVSKS